MAVKCWWLLPYVQAQACKEDSVPVVMQKLRVLPSKRFSVEAPWWRFWNRSPQGASNVPATSFWISVLDSYRIAETWLLWVPAVSLVAVVLLVCRWYTPGTQSGSERMDNAAEQAIAATYLPLPDEGGEQVMRTSS